MSALPTLAIVGPGRLGQAFGKRLVDAGAPFLGFAGRTIQAAAQAVRFAGGGSVLDKGELGDADAVFLAVQDDALRAVVTELAPGARGGLWFHSSGSFDLDVLRPFAERGAAVGSLHPLTPIPDAEVGVRTLAGQPAVVQFSPQDGATRDVLCRIATAVGLRPVPIEGGDRLIYHSACVLAANGLTALHFVVDRLFAAAMPGADVSGLGTALMRAALATCEAEGSVQALSGPVLRGDADLIRRQHTALATLDERGAGVFRALMLEAAEMAVARGELTGEALEQMRRVLAPDA